MTTSPTTDEHDLTPAQAIREAAWQHALSLYARWERAGERARGGPGSAGASNLHAESEARYARTLLDELVREHDFYDTRVDPLGLSWAEHQAAPWTCPPTDRPACTHDTDTCPRHTGWRRLGEPSRECGRRAA